MTVEIIRTPRADQQIKDRSTDDKKRVIAFLRDLEVNGCKALAYRLTGVDPLGHLCDKHLGAELRAIVAFESREKAWLLLVGDHDDDHPVLNVYAEFYRLVGFEPEPTAKRTKPPCCGEDGSAPGIGVQAENLALRAMQLRKTRR